MKKMPKVFLLEYTVRHKLHNFAIILLVSLLVNLLAIFVHFCDGLYLFCILPGTWGFQRPQNEILVKALVTQLISPPVWSSMGFGWANIQSINLRTLKKNLLSQNYSDSQCKSWQLAEKLTAVMFWASLPRLVQIFLDLNILPKVLQNHDKDLEVELVTSGLTNALGSMVGSLETCGSDLMWHAWEKWICETWGLHRYSTHIH